MKISSKKLIAFAWIMAFWRWNSVTMLSGLFHINASVLNAAWIAIIGVAALAAVCIRKEFVLKRGLLSLAVMLAFYAFSLATAKNERGMSYLHNFLIYVILGCVLTTQIIDIEYILRLFCRSCVIAFFAFAFLPFTGSLKSYNNMAFFETGMAYGEMVIAPCFIGIYALFRMKKNWIYLILCAACLGLGFMIANRSSILVCLFFAFLYAVWIEKLSRKRVIQISLLLVVALICILNLRTILEWMLALLDRFGIRSYALTKFSRALSNNTESFLSGRDEILSLALEYIAERPLWGIGFGSFYMRTGQAYVHNIVIDWFSTLGLVGGTVMLAMTGIALWKAFHLTGEDQKIFACILLCLWFPRMMFSKTFADDVSYWMFLVFALSLNRVAAGRYDWHRQPVRGLT